MSGYPNTDPYGMGWQNAVNEPPPCPFCGDDLEYENSDSSRASWYACHKCGTTTPIENLYSRPIEDDLRLRLAKAVKALEEVMQTIDNLIDGVGSIDDVTSIAQLAIEEINKNDST